MRQYRIIGLALVALCCSLPLQVEAKRVDERAAELARLRAEIEQIEGQIQTERSTNTNELKALIAQKAEIALLVQKERIRVRVLREERKRQRVRLRARSAQKVGLVPSLVLAAKTLQAVVKKSLPFAREERLETLVRIERGLKATTLAPQRAAAQLWQLVEDELKLCKETGIHQQVITLDGKRLLVDVARLGMVMMFFRTQSGVYGHSVRQRDGSYRHVLLPAHAAQKSAEALFDALKKQIRTGLFRLPIVPVSFASAGGNR